LTHRCKLICVPVSIIIGLVFLSSNLYAQKLSAPLTPVLFIHGSGLNSNTWTDLKRYLKSRGYPERYLYAVDIKPNNISNVIAAKEFIVPAVNDLLRISQSKMGNSKIDIVAHSMGALSARWFATLIAPGTVRRIITLAGANHGTNSLCDSTAAGDREMCPAYSEKSKPGTVQSKLNHNKLLNYDETPYGIGSDFGDNKHLLPPNKKNAITYFTIYIESDKWIKPANSATLKGAGGIRVKLNSIKFNETSPGNYLFNENISHDDLPKNSDITHAVYKLLTYNVI